jgi:hypothetical protein
MKEYNIKPHCVHNLLLTEYNSEESVMALSFFQSGHAAAPPPTPPAPVTSFFVSSKEPGAVAMEDVETETKSVDVESSPSASHSLAAPFSKNIENLMATSKTPPHQTANQAPPRPKRRRVTPNTASKIGIDHTKDTLHANNARQTFEACHHEHKDAIKQIQAGKPVSRAQEASHPNNQIFHLSDIGMLRAVDDLKVDKDAISAVLLQKWQNMADVYRAEAAIYGVGTPAADTDTAKTKEPTTHADNQTTTTATTPDQNSDGSHPNVCQEKPYKTADWPMELILQRLLKDLPPTRMYSITDSQHEITAQSSSTYLQRLIEQSEQLPVMPASVASQLLRESGKWTVPFGNHMVERNFPSCSNGAQCCGMTVMFPGRGNGIITAWMSKEEYDSFLATARLPMGIDKRICIMCYRRVLDRYMTLIRKNRTRIPNATCCFQYWSVRVGCFDGYVPTACHRPIDTESTGVAFNGFVCPFVGFRITDYCVRLSNGRLVWDQSAIVVQEHPTQKPLPGQRLSSFLERVMLEQRLTDTCQLQYFRSMMRALHPVVCMARDYPAQFTYIFPWTSNTRVCDIDIDFLAKLSDTQMNTALSRLERTMLSFSMDETTTGTNMMWNHLKGMHQLFGDIRFGDWYEKHVGKPMSASLKAYIRTMAPNIYSMGLDVGPHLRQGVFWSEHPPGMSTDLVSLLNKVLPQPCLIRMFSDKLNEFVANNTHGDTMVGNICFISLLGSYYWHPSNYYKCTPVIHPDGTFVKNLDGNIQVSYDIDTMSLTDVQVFALRCMHYQRPELINNIYVQTPQLTLYCMRSLVYAILRNSPEFYQQLEETVAISRVDSVVLHYILYYRRMIRAMIPGEHWIRLLRDDADKTWNETLDHLQMQMASVPMQPRTREATKEIMRTLAKQTKDAMRRVITADVVNAMAGREIQTEDAHLKCSRRRCRRQAIASIHTSKWPHAPPLPDDIYSVMNQWLQYVGDRAVDVMELAQNLYLFPVNKEALREIFDTLTKFDNLQINDRGLNDILHGPKKPTRRKNGEPTFVPLFQKWPYTMQIVRTFSYLYSIHRSCASFVLPRHMILAQCDALRRRWMLRPEEPLPQHDTHLLWCRVCHYIYSIFKSVARRGTSGKSKKSRAVAAGGAVGTREKVQQAMINNRRKMQQTMMKSTTQRRARVSQRSKGTSKRSVCNPWSTNYNILNAYYNQIMSKDTPHDECWPLRSVGTVKFNDMLQTSIRSIYHYRSLSTESTRGCKHLLHATHAYTEGVMHLVTLASLYMGTESPSLVQQEEETADVSDQQLGLWEMQARHLNMLACTVSVVGPETNTTGAPQSLKGASCRTQTGTGYGDWCCLTDMISDTKYCRVGHERGSEKCVNQPLSRTFGLGHITCLGRRAIMMCGNCAGFFVLYTNYCMFTDNGYVCQHCTSFLKKALVIKKQAQALHWPTRIPYASVLPLAITPEERALNEQDTKLPSPSCIKCGNTVVRHVDHFHRVRVYRYGFMVCHRDGYLLNVYLKSKAGEHEHLSKDEYRDYLIRSIATLKRIHHSKQASGRKAVHHKRGAKIHESESKPLSGPPMRGGKRAMDFITRSQQRRSQQIQTKHQSVTGSGK